jgi:valyl-tRNA synthetase
LINLLKLWHPFMPFITEVIWSEIDNNLLMVETWPTENLFTKSIALEINLFENAVIPSIIAIRNARAENNVGPARKVKAIIYAGESLEIIESQMHLLQNLRTGISEIEVLEKGEKIEDAIYINVGGIEIYLVGAVDKEKEMKRIEEEIRNLENIILRSKSLLESEDFVKRAPAPIIMKEQEKLKNAQIELEKLKLIK